MPDYAPCVTNINVTHHISPANTTNDFTSLPHRAYSFAYILCGSADFMWEGGSLSVKKGDILFIPIGMPYTSHWNGKPYSRFISCQFNVNPFCEPFWNRFFHIQKICNLSHLEEDFLYLANEATSSLSAISVFYKITDAAIAHLTSTPAPPVDERIKAVAEYLKHNSTAKTSVSDLAALANMSVPHFERCFKRDIGISPIEFKNRTAIGTAARMLIDNRNTTIEAVSLAAGFDSPIYFRRLFKSHTGKTPSEYRKTVSISL